MIYLEKFVERELISGAEYLLMTSLNAANIDLKYDL